MCIKKINSFAFFKISLQPATVVVCCSYFELFSHFGFSLLPLLLLHHRSKSSAFFPLFFSFFFFFIFFCGLEELLSPLDQGRRRNNNNSSITKTIVCLLFLSSSTKIIQFVCSLSLFCFSPSNPEVRGGERFPMLKAFLKL